MRWAVGKWGGETIRHLLTRSSVLLQGGLSACWEEEGSETSDQYQVGDSATLRYTHAILTPRSCSSEAWHHRPALRPGELKRNRFQIQYRISHSRFQRRRVRHGASLWCFTWAALLLQGKYKCLKILLGRTLYPFWICFLLGAGCEGGGEDGGKRGVTLGRRKGQRMRKERFICPLWSWLTTDPWTNNNAKLVINVLS